MQCPDCGEKLSTVHYGGVELDRCDDCRGYWFDESELQNVINHLLQMPNIPDAKIELDKTVISQQMLSEAKRACPRCGVEMTKVNYAYDSNVIVDRCSHCNGFWLDPGEAQRLAIFVKGNPVLDRMGAAMADHAEEKQRREQQRLGANNPTVVPMVDAAVVLPIGDDAPTSRFSLVVISLILVNVAVFIFQSAYCGSPASQKQLLGTLGMTPATAFSGVQGYLSFITSEFLHAGLLHLLGNMLFLWIFGDNVEDRFGHIRFLGFYLFCGIMAGLCHLSFNWGATVPVIGASGAIAGVMGAYLILFPNNRIKTIVGRSVVEIPAWAYLLVWSGLQFFWALSGTDAPVAWWAHIGGFIFGAIVGILVRAASSLKHPQPVMTESLTA